MSSESRKVRILLVEDNSMDAMMVIEAFNESRINAEVHVVSRGDVAMQYLKRQNEFKDSPRPHLILLDLNLPGKTGHEILKEIKADAQLKRIPVIVLTSSEANEDIVRSYELHANSYIPKPVGLEELNRMRSAIEDFWFSLAKIPEA